MASFAIHAVNPVYQKIGASALIVTLMSLLWIINKRTDEMKRNEYKLRDLYHKLLSTNINLENEISERIKAEEKLQKTYADLEVRIEERTKELGLINKELTLEINERKAMDEKLNEQNFFLNSIIESIPHPFYVVDTSNYRIKLANSNAAQDGQWQHLTCHQLTHKSEEPCKGEEHICPLEEVKKNKKPVVVEHIHFDTTGVEQNVEVHGYPIFDQNGEVIQMIEYSINITKRKKIEREKEKLIEELREAVEKVKTLSSFLPICASCKKIRDDKGYWNQIEQYITKHTGTEFSHSLCPECSKKLYPDIDFDND